MGRDSSLSDPTATGRGALRTGARVPGVLARSFTMPLVAA